jgi:protein phosphatase 2C family protein 2/3
MKPKSKEHMIDVWPKCSFFGIYDGHGGSQCAEFLRDYLHQFIIKDDNFPSNPVKAIRNGFREAERLFLEFAEK